MTYTVEYVRNNKKETHSGLSRMEAELLSAYVRKTFRLTVSVSLNHSMKADR